jgi:hypothetical protein
LIGFFVLHYFLVLFCAGPRVTQPTGYFHQYHTKEQKIRAKYSIMASDANPGKKKLPVVVIKKRAGSSKNKMLSSRRTQQIAVAVRPRRGLPASKQVAVAKEDASQKDTTDLFNGDEDDDLVANMACNTALAIQSLQHLTETCIDIPLLSCATSAGNMMIRGVLECQLHEWFLKNGGSSQNVSRELNELLRSNQLRQLSSASRHADPLTLYVSTTDYVRGVQAAITQEETVAVDWFVRHLNIWTSSRIDRAVIEEAWNADPPVSNSVRSALDLIRWLQECQILLSASSDHDSYQLWLPGWGSAVLPAFFKAVKDALVFLKQSSYKERACDSVVRRLSHSPIPVTDVLIPWLVGQGHVQRIERSSGPFCKLAIK